MISMKLNNELTKRSKNILVLYKQGKTIEEIGIQYGFTRSRAQQIISKQIKKDIVDRYHLQNLTDEEVHLLNVAVSEEIQEIYNKRRQTLKESNKIEIEQRIQIKINSLPDYHNFNSLTAYVRALGEDVSDFKKYFPDIAETIIELRKKKWSWYYNQCRKCGTTSIEHASHGLCKACYLKSDYFKEINEASRLRNRGRWKSKIREYHKQYTQRPEIKEKLRILDDLKRYGGNREKTIMRDNNACRLCGITREDSKRLRKRDLYVGHLNGIDDNSMENLITTCNKCHISLMKQRDSKRP